MEKSAFSELKSWDFTHSRSSLPSTTLQTAETTAGNTALDFIKFLVTLLIF